MKALAPVVGVLLLAAAAFGGYSFGKKDATITPDSPAYQEALKVGQLATVVEIIERGLTNPCQTIYLYNKSDEANPREVNLINVTCEGLNLPDINEAREEAPNAE